MDTATHLLLHHLYQSLTTASRSVADFYLDEQVLDRVLEELNAIDAAIGEAVHVPKQCPETLRHLICDLEHRLAELMAALSVPDQQYLKPMVSNHDVRSPLTA